MAIVDSSVNAVLPLSHGPELLDSPVGRTFPGIEAAAPALRRANLPNATSIVIVGGGIIGAAIACQLLRMGVAQRDILLIDEHPRLLEAFLRMSRTVGQRVMRSSYEHQLAPDGAVQLLDFARLFHDRLTATECAQVELALAGQRSVVPWDLFKAHSIHTMSTYEIAKVAYRARVTGLSRMADRDRVGWEVTCADGARIGAPFVILATGSRRRPLPEPLAEAQRQWPDRVVWAYDQHKFAQGERIAVVGGGLAAGHVLLSALGAGAQPLWILRSEERYRCTDFHTRYVRAEGRASFQALSPTERAVLLQEENRGSLMLEMLPLLEAHEQEQRLEVRRGETVEHVTSANDCLMLRLTSGHSVSVDQMIVATGFVPDTNLVPTASRLAADYPVVDDRTLEIEGSPGLFAAGVLASLSLGPAARNIDGARLWLEIAAPLLLERLTKSRQGAVRRKISGMSPIEGCRRELNI